MNDALPRHVRANACAAYLCLAPFFLLAFRNPRLAHPFVRSHARKALAPQLLLAGAWAAFGWWGAGASVAVPYLGISVARMLATGLYLLAALWIFLGVSAAAKGGAASASGAPDSGALALGASLESAPLDESSKARVLLSYVPLLGFFAAAHEPRPAAVLGARLGAWYAFVALLLAALWRADASLSALTLAYVLLASFVAVQLFALGRAWRWAAVESLPDAQRAGLLARTAADWAWCALRAAFGRKAPFSWSALLAARADLEGARDALALRRFDAPALPGGPWAAYVPVANLALWFFTRGGRSRGVPALRQGSALSVLLLVCALWFPAAAPFLAIPFALGAANAGRDPAYKVPVAFELSSLAVRAAVRVRGFAAAAVRTGQAVETVSLPVGPGPKA